MTEDHDMQTQHEKTPDQEQREAEFVPRQTDELFWRATFFVLGMAFYGVVL